MFSAFIIHFYQWSPCSLLILKYGQLSHLTHSGTAVESNVSVIQMLLKEAGIQFLVAENEQPACIYERLLRV
jgi:hypothetical protein